MNPAATGSEIILKWFAAFRVSRALYVAAQLDVARFVSEGAADIATLAGRTGTHAPTLYRLMRALSSEGIFRECADGTFEHTEASEALRDDLPDSLRTLVLVMGDDTTSWQPWEHLVYSVRTGRSAFDHVHGETLFDHLARHPEKAAMFDRGMGGASRLVNDALVRVCDFSGVTTLVDVAGGTGSTLCALLRANPALRGVLFDLAHLRERAQARIAAEGLSDRCTFAAGSFFEGIPAGGDAYFMKHILHDWDDEDCARILRACRTAMNPGGRLLVCERIVSPGNVPDPVRWTDLHMLVCTHGGRERTRGEFTSLLETSGFGPPRVIETGSPWVVLEARPG